MMRNGWWMAVAGALAIVAVAVLAALVRDDSSPDPVVTIPTATPPNADSCPVDAPICDFAKRVEFEYREGDPRNLVSPKSEHYGEVGIIDAGIGSWRAAPFYPHVIGIGCSIEPGGTVCGEAFSLVLTAYPEHQQTERISRVLLGFVRDGEEIPILTTNRLTGGDFNVVTSGVDSGDCGLAGVIDDGPCLGTRFIPYTTGPAVARQPADPTPTPSPGDPLEGVEIVRMQPGMQSSIGYDTIVYYSTGCFACGRSQIPNLYRAYRDSSGQLRTDDLFGPLLSESGGYPKDVAADWDRGHLLVLICTAGYCGGEGEPSPDAAVALYRSIDGGVTWALEEDASLPVESFFTGMVDGKPIVGTVKRQGLDFEREYSVYPAHQPLSPPREIGPATPYPDREGRIGWLATSALGGFFANNGLLLVPPVPEYRLVRVLPLGGARLAHWIPESPGAGVFGMFHGTGDLAGAFEHEGYADFRGQLPTGLLYGNVELAETFGFGVDGGGDACKENQRIYPALVNWTTGSTHPIIELGDCEQGRHKFVNAMLSRTVVRVTTGADCLNVRSEPTTSSASIGCFADGVLLGVRGDGPPPVVQGWVPVVTPALEAGWVSEEFLER